MLTVWTSRGSRAPWTRRSTKPCCSTGSRTTCGTTTCTSTPRQTLGQAPPLSIVDIDSLTASARPRRRPFATTCGGVSRRRAHRLRGMAQVWGARRIRVGGQVAGPVPGHAAPPGFRRDQGVVGTARPPFHEVVIETNGHNLALVFSDLRVDAVSPGTTPFVIPPSARREVPAAIARSFRGEGGAVHEQASVKGDGDGRLHREEVAPFTAQLPRGSPSRSTGLNRSMLPKSGSPEASVEEALAMPHEARCLRG